MIIVLHCYVASSTFIINFFFLLANAFVEYVEYIYYLSEKMGREL